MPNTKNTGLEDLLKNVSLANYPGFREQKKRIDEIDKLDSQTQTRGNIDRSDPPPRMGNLGGGKKNNLKLKYNMPGHSRSKLAGRSRRACKGKKLSNCRRAKTCKVVRKRSGRKVCRSATKKHHKSRRHRGGMSCHEGGSNCHTGGKRCTKHRKGGSNCHTGGAQEKKKGFLASLGL